ncbi:DNA recombination protein RmuC [Roseateles koreensis]|uniref:DNA recombination protein RmuC n=1 Tax=Roseateles koreensis TaxID=2987526 RepID=A0ABT5KSJ8_9BURK|nr:DNA recombination protein RmuC [Roseateles koreensis]MDC8785904.1 DNA recombination protein RmuC [Roseateles koreensis]
MNVFELLMVGLLALVMVVLLIGLWLQARARAQADAWGSQLGALLAAQMTPLQQASNERLERMDRQLRDELTRSGSGTRQELLQALSQFQQALLNQGGDVARTQNEQIDSFRLQLGALQQSLSDGLQSTAQSLTSQALAARQAQDEAQQRSAQTQLEALQQVARAQSEQIDSFRQQLGNVQQDLSAQALAAREAQDAAAVRATQAQTEALQRLGQAVTEQLKATAAGNEQRLGQLQAAVDQRLSLIQQDNEKKLEQMRATVDEKLHATLEQRLGESFKQVADRLEQVHKGLGEMQNLARDVGSLNRVLTNVKTRGIFGEVQLAGLLEQVFTPEQYASNVATIPGSAERVEFAIALPGQRDDGAPLWLPIDAKFPREDYERLLDAQDRADVAGVEASAKAIETRLRLEAKTIREKYIAPPHTTDFGMLFVPTEGLYAEALRRPGLVESLQRDHKVMLVGPTTLLATLTSLQMGFRTLALEKRSAEVWEVLGAVKTEFGKFGDVLAKTKKKLEEASNTIDAAETRTRAMTRKLKSVEALPEEAAVKLLKLGLGDAADALASQDNALDEGDV